MNMLNRMIDPVEVGSVGGAETPFRFCAATEEGHDRQALDCPLRVLVQERDAPVLEKIGTLRAAQDVVCSELTRLARAQPLDRLALRQLGILVHGFADQAETLILAMVKRGGADSLVEVVDEIFDSFRDAERLIEIALKRGRP